MADRGLSQVATGIGITGAVLAFPLSHIHPGGMTLRIGFLTLAAIVLDFGGSATLVTSQRAIFSLGAATRSRLNGLFMSAFFLGGASGSAVSGWAYARAGWPLASALGFALPLVALAVYLTEFRTR